MTGRPLDVQEIREVLRLLSRELGVTPTAEALAEQPELQWLGDPVVRAHDAALAAPCRRCSHHIACHVGGRAGTGWAIYDRVWQDAAGSCSIDGCDCQRAHRG
jgi:hypothetical protein